LRLQQRHNKSCQGQDEQQAGKNSAHEQEDFTTSQRVVMGGQIGAKLLPGPSSAAKMPRRAITVD
jgi:hypothetical protein